MIVQDMNRDQLIAEALKLRSQLARMNELLAASERERTELKKELERLRGGAQ